MFSAPYLRLPYDPDPGDDADPAERAAYRANREVRHTVIRVITAHLQEGAAVSWQGLNFDFTGVIFYGGSFDGAPILGRERAVRRRRVLWQPRQLLPRRVLRQHGQLRRPPCSPGGTVNFAPPAVFSGRHGQLRRPPVFSDGTVSFGTSRFSGGTVDFDGARFFDGTVDFSGPWRLVNPTPPLPRREAPQEGRSIPRNRPGPLCLPRS